MPTPTPEEFTEFQNPSSASVERLIQALDRTYHHMGNLMWRNFIAGLMYAFGATIGFAIVLGAAAYILRGLGGVSVFKPAIDKLDDLIISHTQSVANTTQEQAVNQILNQTNKTPTPTP